MLSDVPSAPRFLVDVFSFVVHAEFEVGVLAPEEFRWKIYTIKRYQGQNSVPNRNRHSERPAQRIYDRHSVSRRGTAYYGQAQRKDSSTYLGQAQCIEDRHSVSRTGTAYRAQAQRI